MKVTRRKLFGSLLGLFAIPVAVKAATPQIIHATDPGAEKLEAYDPETGYVPELVQSVCVGKWIEQLQVREGRLFWTRKGELARCRIEGNWQVRPVTQQEKSYKVGRSTIFNPSPLYPLPYPVHCSV